MGVILPSYSQVLSTSREGDYKGHVHQGCDNLGTILEFSQLHSICLFLVLTFLSLTLTICQMRIV